MIYKKVFDAKIATHEEWLAFRKTGIGGSDMAAIMGLSKWKSPLDVWLEKTSNEVNVEETRFTYWGTKLEALVAEEFTIQTGYSVRNNNYTLQSIEYPFLLANIDRDIVGLDAGLECKTANAFKRDEWEGDQVPDDYYIQCQHYMAVTGYSSWWIACLCGGNEFFYKEIPRNEEVITAIIEAGREFWNMVEQNIMPAVDDSERCNKLLKELHSKSNGKSIELPDTAKIYIEQYNKAKADETAAKARKTEAQSHLFELLGANEKGIIDQYTVIWSPVAGRKKFDTKRFENDHPQLAAAYTVQGQPSRRFDIKGAK
ncbi:YqaJ viral recombinase family protein [Veillonella sp. R32]|uniref:YqaJ viral recombinase family nuclease n=1 Tax=Veillonella sp. R32 TaxID=2021312 RepID=UPI0013895B28|nr:YqaJ viral recombinase family protein [Veillonella sp. R32]KAF1680472.1 hypothetical protein VER_08530 [Veillonella sp. R32]